MSKSQTKKCSRERGVVFSERARVNRIINGGCASFYRAVMSEDDDLVFRLFLSKVSGEKKRRKLTFLSLLNTRERFFSKRTSSSSGTFYDDAFRREGREDQ